MNRVTASPPAREIFEVTYVDSDLKEHSTEAHSALELQAVLEQIRVTGGYPRCVVRCLY